MANYVVDATIVLHYLLSQTHTVNARAFFNQVTSSDQLIVPEFCLVECTNVIWKQVRFFGMSTTDGLQTLKDLRALPLYRTLLNRC